MDLNPYKTILDKLHSAGESAVDEIITSGDQESFFVDFKMISTQAADSKISEDDRKNFAKAISGFANTSGGLLIWGVHDNRQGSFSGAPINYTDKFVGFLNGAVSKLTLPVQNEVNSFSIKNSGDMGYVITEIPKYYFSPVQVTPNIQIKDISGRYYIRSGSDFVVANHDIISGLYNRQRRSEINYCWGDRGEKPVGGDDGIIYHFDFILQNKGLGILRDVWINFTTNNPDLVLSKTSQSKVFIGWSVFGQALNLVTNDQYKLAPQHFLSPFSMTFKLPKKIDNDFYFYISFGADQVAPKEIEIKITKEKLGSFLKEGNRDLDFFLKHFGFSCDLVGKK